jgi:hypothetical protein
MFTNANFKQNTLNTANNVSTQSTTAQKTAITTDVDITPVGNTINPSNYVYDGQTILLINSTINPNANVIKAQYFDPVAGEIPPSSFSGSIVPNLTNWNYDLVNTSYLNGAFSSSALLQESTYLYNNLQPISNALGQYNIDIENGNEQTSSGASDNTMFFSLTSQPYVCYQGNFYTTPGNSNVNPQYSANNSDNFLFTSNYYVQQKNEILIIQLVYTVSNTNSLNVQNTTASSTIPNVSVIVYNKVISKDALASLSSGSPLDGPKTKVYTAGPIPLQVTQPGQPFDPTKSNYSVNNNVPIVIAPGYTKQYATLPLIYIAPYYDQTSGNYYAQYLNDNSSSSPGIGYYIENNLIKINTTNTTVTTEECSYGYFCVAVSFSTDYATYQPGWNIKAEILIRNIWRAPNAIYRSYSAFSTNDMATKQVVLLFGKTFNGGTFLVTNTGTPLSLIDSYAVTSLRNFMAIMSAIYATYDGSVALVDYFINPNVVQNLNSTALNFNVNVLTLQPLLDGSIVNPPTVLTCPNMWYLLIKSPNSVNISVDPTNQPIFGQNIGASYFGLTNSVLCRPGDIKYFNTDIDMLAVANGTLFGNTIYAGINTINNQLFYTLIILPESLFSGSAQTIGSNSLSIYSSVNTIYYIITSPNTSAQFIPSSTSITSSGTSGTSGSTFSITPTYTISKLTLSVSNVDIF